MRRLSAYIVIPLALISSLFTYASEQAFALSPAPYKPIRLKVNAVNGDVQFSFEKAGKLYDYDYYVANGLLRIRLPLPSMTSLRLEVIRAGILKLQTTSSFIELCYGAYPSEHCSNSIDMRATQITSVDIRPSGDFRKASQTAWILGGIGDSPKQLLLHLMESEPACKPYTDTIIKGEKQDFDPFEISGSFDGETFIIQGVQTVDFSKESLDRYADGVRRMYQSHFTAQRILMLTICVVFAGIALVPIGFATALFRKRRKRVAPQSMGSLLTLQSVLLVLVMLQFAFSVVGGSLWDFSRLFGEANFFKTVIWEAVFNVVANFITLVAEGVVLCGIWMAFRPAYFILGILLLTRMLLLPLDTVLRLWPHLTVKSVVSMFSGFSVEAGVYLGYYGVVSVLSFVIWRKTKPTH